MMNEKGRLRRNHEYLANQAALIAFANKKLEEFFPKSSAAITHNPKDFRYSSWATVEHYFNSGFIDVSLVKRLQEGGRLLSVGVGLGYLEELLIRGFEIPRDSVTLVDREISGRTKKAKLGVKRFDMTGEWSGMVDGFSAILFPESYGVAFSELHSTDKFRGHIRATMRFEDDIRQFTDFVLHEKQKPSKNTIDVSLVTLEMDIPFLQEKVDTLASAIDRLGSGGEVRLIGHGLREQELAYVLYCLKREFHHLEFHLSRRDNAMLVIKQAGAMAKNIHYLTLKGADKFRQRLGDLSKEFIRSLSLFNKYLDAGDKRKALSNFEIAKACLVEIESNKYLFRRHKAWSKHEDQALGDYRLLLSKAHRNYRRRSIHPTPQK